MSTSRFQETGTSVLSSRVRLPIPVSFTCENDYMKEIIICAELLYTVRSLTYIFAYLHSYQSLIVPVYTQAARRSRTASLPCSCWADPVFQPCWPVCYHMTSHMAAAVFKPWHDFTSVWSRTLNKDRQCCESWRDAEFGFRAVCAVGDTTDEDRWVDLLCCSPHCDTA